MKPAALLLLIQFSLSVASQSLSFNQYTPAEGLVDTRVGKIFQDSRGVMYFLTPDGFSVFDGQRFTNYSQYQNQSLSIVSDIVEEKNGRILIVSISGIYFLQNNKLEKDTAFFNRSLEPGSVHITPSGEKIIAANSGLMLYDGGKTMPLDIQKEDGTKQPLKTDKVILKDDNLIIAYSNQKLNRQYLALYNWKEQKLISEITSEPGINMMHYQEKIFVFLKKEWYELNTEEFNKGKLITQPLYFATRIPAGKKIFNFFIDTQKKIWLITTDKQFYVIDPAKNETLHYSSANGLPDGLSNIFQDRENNYWLTVAGKGVYKMTQNRVEKFILPGKKQIPFIEQFINKSPEGIISFKYGSKLGIITNNVFIEKKMTEKPGVKQVFFWNNRRWTLYDNYRLESEKGDTIQLISFLPESKLVSSRISFDKAGRLLISGNYFSVVSKDLTFATTELPWFTDNIVTDDDSNYWCFTRSAYIVSYRLKDNRLQLQQTYRNADYSTRFAYQWNKDTFCIGTRHNGIVFVKINSREYKKLGSIGKEKGLSNNFAVDIIRLNQHKLVVACVPGLDLVHLNKEDTAAEQLFSRAGLFTTVPSIQLMNDSLLVALDESGSLYKVHVSSSAMQPLTPSFYFNEITVNGKQTDSAINHYRYTENNFRFSVSAPSFIDEKNIRFVFELTGPGTNAVQNSKRAEFEYSNLQPGSYTLTATAFFPGDEPVSKTISYSFTIKKPFWKTAGFIAGLIAFISLLLYAYFKNILQRRLQRQKVELEKQQAIAHERSRISRDMHDDMGSGLTKIAILSEVAKKQLPEPDKAREQLEKISESSRELVDSLQDIIWVLNPKNDTLESLSAYVREYALKYFEPFAVKVDFVYPEQFFIRHLSEEKRRNVYLTVKESLNNIAKHAWSNNVIIEIKELTGQFKITIQDDGKGFEPGKVRLFANGLKNMQNRVEQAGGTYEISSSPGKGTITGITMPV